jgi:Tfp pilus assembly protein PilO
MDPAIKLLKKPIVIAVVFGLAYAWLLWVYMGAHTERQGLKAEINDLRAELSVNPAQTAGLEAEHARYLAVIAEAERQLVLTRKDSGILEQILATADATGVRIASAGISENVVAPLGTDIYEVTPILLQVDGSLEGLQLFVSQLEGKAIHAMEVGNSTISNSELGYTATIRTLVYNKPVSPESLGEKDVVPTGRVTNEELDRAAGGGS